MQPVQEGGARIIAGDSGSLSGIQGRFYPILDTHDRMYLYSDGVIINGGQSQPVRFELDEPVHLRSLDGTCVTLWFREMIGTSCIFDYSYERDKRVGKPFTDQ